MILAACSPSSVLIARSRRLVMRVLLANDRTQTQHKIRSLAGSNKSPGLGNEKPRPGEEKAGALRDGRRRGAPGGNVSV
jgi:hypothetical protein